MFKKIKSTTLLFLFILLFVHGFAFIFGQNNNLVGVGIIVSMLVLMQENLMKKPLKSFIALLVLQLVLGAGSAVASQHLWLGFPINFLILSSIGYLLSASLTKLIIIPFGLEYIFMTYTPVTGKDLLLRFLGLAIGAVLIMLSQKIIYGKKEGETGESLLVNPTEKTKHGEFYRHGTIFGKPYCFHMIRGSYAIRIGFITALCMFLVHYLQLAEGRWIVYTIFSLTEIYSENCRERSWQRLEGTLIGSGIILLLFFLIPNNTIRGLLVLLGGYLDGFTNNYRDKMICVTMSVVAAVSLTNGTMATAIERIIYVIIGIVLAVLVDRVVFHTSLKKINRAI